jgi:hypothetical protein
VKRIKAFALFEKEEIVKVNASLGRAVQDILEPYVSFPELHKNQFHAWYCITQGWGNYSAYLADLPQGEETMSQVKFQKYHETYHSGEFGFMPNHNFNRVVGDITQGRLDLKWGENFQNQSVEELMESFKRPYYPCWVIHQVLQNDYRDPQWVTVQQRDI